MTNVNAFTHLCDVTDDLLACVKTLPASIQRARLFAIIEEYDALIDALVGIDILELARAEMEEPL